MTNSETQNLTAEQIACYEAIKNAPKPLVFKNMSAFRTAPAGFNVRIARELQALGLTTEKWNSKLGGFVFAAVR